VYCEQTVVDQACTRPTLSGPALARRRVVPGRPHHRRAKLHTGKMSYDDAGGYGRQVLARHSVLQGRGEALLSVAEPADDYLVGKTQLLALRDEYRKRMGDRFSLQDSTTGCWLKARYRSA